ncbi:hypothetical protein SESBI_37143 [Sesbania bispinosa]|nr:hypothetical protein SESBI_37143 [Sesbania bispinosa]
MKKGNAHVSVQLPDEAGEVVVLKMVRQDVSGELRNIPNNKGVVVMTPRHHRVGGRVIHHVVRLAQERWHTLHYSICICGSILNQPA